MDMNKMKTNGVFTMNDKHTVRTRTQHNTQSWIEPFRVFDKPKCFSHNSLIYS